LPANAQVHTCSQSRRLANKVQLNPAFGRLQEMPSAAAIRPEIIFLQYQQLANGLSGGGGGGRALLDSARRLGHAG
jgi:hypothetical protein